MNNLKKIITCFLISLFSISLISNNVFALDLKSENRNEEETKDFSDGILNLGEKEFKILETIVSGLDSINKYFKEKGINEIKVSDKIRKNVDLVVYLQ